MRPFTADPESVYYFRWLALNHFRSVNFYQDILSGHVVNKCVLYISGTLNILIIIHILYNMMRLHFHRFTPGCQTKTQITGADSVGKHYAQLLCIVNCNKTGYTPIAQRHFCNVCTRPCASCSQAHRNRVFPVKQCLPAKIVRCSTYWHS